LGDREPRKETIMSNIRISLLLLITMLVVSGCTSSPARPSSFTFQGVSWKISSVETMKASETWLRPAESAEWVSDVLLIITFEVQGDPLPQYRDAELRRWFSDIMLRETGRTAEQFFPNSQEQGGPIDSMICIFSIDEGTESVELVLPDSQTIEITVKG